jgi:hypothetical protein
MYHWKHSNNQQSERVSPKSADSTRVLTNYTVTLTEVIRTVVVHIDVLFCCDWLLFLYIDDQLTRSVVVDAEL